MKSGGIFGGGEGPAPGITPISIAPAEVKGGIDAGGLSLNSIHNTNMGFGIADRLTGIANNYFAYQLAMKQFTMYEDIADAKIAAEREFNVFNRDLSREFMQYADSANKRQVELQDKVSARHEATELEKHRITTDAQKEMHESDIVDRAFGMRSEPFYGLPS